MATLEIRSIDGRTRQFVMRRSSPILFGSGPQCELQIDDPDVPPVHGRIGWSKGRYRVELMPNTPPVCRNGQRVLAAGFRRGDIFVFGQTEVEMLFPPGSEPADSGTTARPRSAEAGGRSVQGSGGSAAPVVDDRPNLHEWVDDDDDEESESEDESSGEDSDRDQVLPEDPIYSDTPNLSTLSYGGNLAPPQQERRGWFGLFGSDAPGQERIASSPLVIGLSAAFLLLLVLGAILWSVTRQQGAQRLFQQSELAFEDGRYRDVQLQLDEFLERYPDSELAGEARVLRNLSQVYQFSTGRGAWTNALEAAQAMVEEVGELPAFADSRVELGAQVLRTADGLAERTAASADPSDLTQAEAALALHAEILGAAAEERRERSGVDASMARAREAVTKEQRRLETLAAMDEALGDDAVETVYQSREQIVLAYPDLALDADVVARLESANDVVRSQVTGRRLSQAGVRQPRLDPLGRATSLVIRQTGYRDPEGGTPAYVYAQTDGMLFALDGRTGTPLWQRPIGTDGPFLPQPIRGREDVLVFDTRFNELIRIDRRNGALVWRQEVGERVNAPPLVLGNQVIQVLPSGRILFLALDDGGLRAEVDVGRRLTQTALTDDIGRYLYVLGERDNVFVIDRNELVCAKVLFLGHDRGAIAHPASQFDRFLIVPDRNRVDTSRLHVLVRDEEGSGISEVQQLEVDGWTWQAPLLAGNFLWAAGDRGNIHVWSADPEEPRTPLSAVARTDAKAESDGPTYALNLNPRRCVIASEPSVGYRLDPSLSELSSQWNRFREGPAIAPPQPAGGLVVLTHQAPDSEGVRVAGIDPENGQVRWSTQLGSPWIAGLIADPNGSGLVTLDLRGRPVRITPETLDAGGFITVEVPRSGTVQLPEQPWSRFETARWRLILAESDPDAIWVASGAEAIRAIPLPAVSGVDPLIWGETILVLGRDGRAQQVDPITGQTTGEPYLRSFDRNEPTDWLNATRLENDGVALVETNGRVRRLDRSRDGDVVTLEVPFQQDLEVDLVARAATTGPALILVAAEDDGRNIVRVLAARDLSPLATFPLQAGLVRGPLSVDDYVFLVDADRRAYAFGPDGDRIWTVRLGDSLPIGAPAIRDGRLYWLDGEGRLQIRSLADGVLEEAIPLFGRPVDGPILKDQTLLIPTGSATIRAWLPESPMP